MEKDSQYRYTLRKLSVGLTSVAIGLAFVSGTTTKVHADTTEQQTENNEKQVVQTSSANEVVDQVSDTDSNTKNEPVKQQDTTTPDTVEKTREVTVNTKDDAANNSTINNVETEKQTDLNNNQELEVKDGQSKEVTTQATPVKNTLNQEDAKKQFQPEENKQKVDPELVKSATDKLSTIRYNVFDIREATDVWANDQLINWYLSDSFKQVHDQLPTLVPQMLEHADNDTASQRVDDNAAAIMLGMSYINHYYNISFGDKELLPTMMFDPKALGSNLDSIDWLTSIGKLSYNELLPKNNVDTFNKKLAPMLNTKDNLVTFLGDLRKNGHQN